MRFRPQEGRERVSPPDLTPLVDVVFLLIIFFLTTSSLVELSKANIELTRARGEENATTDQTALVINIDEKGQYIVENATITYDALMSKVDAEVRKSGGPDQVELLIRADKRASLSAVNRLAEGLIKMDVTKWRLATEVPPEARGRWGVSGGGGGGG